MKRIIVHTLDELETFSNDFNWGVFSLDTETTSLKYDTLELTGISLCDGNSVCYIVNPSTEILSFLAFALGDKGTGKLIIMHNSVFDLKVLHKYYIELDNCELFDTMIADHLVDENRPHGLKYLAKELLGETPISYEEASVNGTDTEGFYDYAMNDAVYTFELAKLLKVELQSQSLDKLFRKVEMPFQFCLLDMVVNGILVDKKKILDTQKQLVDTIIDLETKMLDLIGEPYEFQTNLVKKTIKPISNISFNSSQQLSKLLFDKLGLPVIDRTPSGKPSVGKTTLTKLKGKHAIISLLSTYKLAQKLLNSFFKPLPKFIDSDGRVRPGFKDHGTVTGRLSSSNPNIQQLPNYNDALPIHTRECFIASPGMKMVAVDYSQQELRIMAHLSKDKKLIKIILDGGDLHLINANTVFDLGLDESKLYKSHPEYKQLKETYKIARRKGKVFSFGIPYGMGEHKLSRDFDVSEAEASILLNKFFSNFPMLKQAIADTHSQALEQLYVKTIVGRRRRFTRNQWGKLDGKALRQSFNFLIQSLGADMIRIACVNFRRYIKKNPRFGVKMLATVHDELLFEVKEEFAGIVASASEKILEGVAGDNFVVPLLAEANCGYNYSECK